MLNIIFGLMLFGYIYEDADSLLVMGNDSLLFSGTHQYNLKVHITDGGKIIVRSWTVMDTTGRLTLIAPYILIHGGAVMTASGNGYLGGDNSHPSGYGPGNGIAGGLSGGAGGGGAYGGDGGNGGDQYPGAGGSAYGNYSDTMIDMGSGGGAGRLAEVDGFGGNGGGSIYLKGRTLVMDTATITARGRFGIDGSLEAGGAGSGGGIMIRADTVRISFSSLNAAGGQGGYGDFGGGGGGGGGRIKVFYTSRLDTSSAVIGCSFGSGGQGGISNGGDGEAGTIYIGPLIGVDELGTGYVTGGMISPNPGQGRFAIINPMMDNRELVIYDIQGRIMRSQMLRQGKNIIWLTDLPSGVYVLKMGGLPGHRKLVIVK